jgi:hypothetical protein
VGSFLTEVQRTLLVDVLDLIIPEAGEMPGAGAIAVEHVESAATTRPTTSRTVLGTLMAVDAAAGSEYGEPFTEIADSFKASLLRVVERMYPKLFGEFVDLVYDGYYTDASVIERLGPDAGKPQPEGRPIAPFDPQIVESVRQLGPKYRTAQ